jgi:hypothetical protein
VVVPNWNPSIVLVAGLEIQIGSVSCQALTVIVESENGSVWLRNASQTVAPATA